MRRESFTSGAETARPRELRHLRGAHPAPLLRAYRGPRPESVGEKGRRRAERLARTLPILPARGSQHRSTDRPNETWVMGELAASPKRPEKPRSRAGRLPNARRFRGSRPENQTTSRRTTRIGNATVGSRARSQIRFRLTLSCLMRLFRFHSSASNASWLSVETTLQVGGPTSPAMSQPRSGSIARSAPTASSSATKTAHLRARLSHRARRPPDSPSHIPSDRSVALPGTRPNGP
jgi:hypothetical protein